MLAYKVDGEHPASYSDLLLAKQKAGKMGRSQEPFTTQDNYN